MSEMNGPVICAAEKGNQRQSLIRQGTLKAPHCTWPRNGQTLPLIVEGVLGVSNSVSREALGLNASSVPSGSVA